MTIGLLQLELLIPGSRSLKDKRKAMSSLKSRLKSRFNCSVAETAFKEKWARSELCVCVVSDEHSHVEEQLNSIGRFAEQHPSTELTGFRIEYF